MSNKKSISITGKRNIDSFSNKPAVRNIKYKQRDISISEIHDIFLFIKNHDYKHNKDDTSQQFSNKQKYIYQTLYTKSYSYFNQDKTKRSELPREIIPVKILIDKLIKNNYKCSYCNQNVKIIYDKVRDPLQWTLDRIDNSLNHTDTNCVISCLKCNLKRKTLEKKIFEKWNIVSVKKNDTTKSNADNDINKTDKDNSNDNNTDNNKLCCIES
tara:strand:+ start:72 stop:710 length:639 start_codon:yes stop_codon:yes gene_type:complete